MTTITSGMWRYILLPVAIAALLSIVAGCQQAPPAPAAPTAAAKAAPVAPTAAPAALPPAATKPAAAPQPTTAPAATKPTGKLVVAVGSFGFEQTLPQEASVANHVYWNAMYDFLFYRDQQGNLTPGLAAKWELAQDRRTWTMQLRPGIKWHSGDDFTAEDVKFTLELLSDAKSVHLATPALRSAIDRMEVLNPQTLAIHTKDVFATLPPLISEFNSVPIISKKYVERVGMDQAREKPVGTGPFKFVAKSKGQYIKFEALENHWRQTPSFKELEIRLVAEPSTRLAMLRRGEADIIELPLSFKKEAAAAKVRTLSVPGSFVTMMYLGGQFLETRPGYDASLPWLKKEVRQALNLAVNRQEMVDHVYFGEGVPAGFVGPLPGQPEFDPALKPYPYDPAKAKQLLASAGYPNGFDLEIKVFPRPGVPDLPAQAEAVAQFWQAIEVKAKLTQTEWGAIRPAIAKREKVSWVANHSQGPFDIVDLYTNVYTEKGVPMMGTERLPKTLELVQAASREVDDHKRVETLRAAAKLIYDDYITVPVAYVNAFFALSDKVGDWPVLMHNGGPNYFEYVTPRR